MTTNGKSYKSRTLHHIDQDSSKTFDGLRTAHLPLWGMELGLLEF